MQFNYFISNLFYFKHTIVDFIAQKHRIVLS